MKLTDRERVDGSHTAKRIIQSLMQSGQPPKSGASLFNVGTEQDLNRLRHEYLEDYLLAFEGQYPFTTFCQRSKDGAASCRKWALRALQKNSKMRRLC